MSLHWELKTGCMLNETLNPLLYASSIFTFIVLMSLLKQTFDCFNNSDELAKNSTVIRRIFILILIFLLLK